MANYYGLIVQGPAKEKKQIPLKSVAVSGRIKGYVFGLETRLTYLNSSNDPLEVMFRFPIDESSAVVGLEARINGRTIKGEVREKEEARQMYDDALSSGLSAALGEEKTKDIFSLALGNLPPKGEAEIVLKLCGEMPIDKESGAARFSLPTVLKPRYTPAGPTDPLAAIGGEGDQVEKGSAPAVSSFNIVVDRAEGVSSITSPTHDIKACPKDDGTAEVTLTTTNKLDKDLIILVQYQYCHTPRALVEKGKEEKGNQLMSNPAVMLEFFPKFASLQAACEFLFVIDRSGSMQGAYINSARETLVLFLKSIPPGCYFNIIGFGSRYEHLFPISVPYNQTNLDKGMKHAQNLSANLGGTELLRPLQYAFEQKSIAGLPRQIFVLTDGSVSNTDNCINLTRKNVHTARVFTFGIGSGASTALVKGLARAGNGSAEFIKEGERLQGKVISSLKKALQPSITNVDLKFSVPNGIEVLQAPNKIPPVFNGEKLVLYGWLKGGSGKSGHCSAVLRGKILGSDVKHEIDFQLDDKSLSSDMPIVHQLAAKSLIQDWESEKDKKKAAIIKLSIESSVVSSYTSYIAVDEEQDKPIEGAIKTYDLTADTVPSFLTGGMNMLVGLAYSAPSPPGGFSFCSARAGPPLPKYGGFGFNSLSSNIQMDTSCDLLGGGGPPPPPPPSAMSQPLYRSMDPMGSMGPPPPPNAPLIDLFGAPPPPPPPPMNAPLTDLFGGPPPPPVGGGSSVSYASSFGLASRRVTESDSDLSRLITLQAAEGYWSLNESLASILGRSLSDLKSSCPSGVSEVVWGTILALAFLETKYSSQRDEWELLSMKSEMWVQGHVLPTGTTVATLTELAKQVLA